MSETTLRTIPFNRPGVVGNELDYVREAIEGGHTSAGGPFTERAAALLADLTSAPEVLLTTSCTAALELSAMLLRIRPGDTVVVPSFTFTSSALAFAREGAGLVFCDIEPVTLGVDPEHLAELMDESVRAVVVVHYAGVACDIDGIRRVLDDWPHVALIEDNAHGLCGTFRGQPLGSFGRFATQSFHDTKNFVCGEGGALLLNDPADVDRARVLHEKGTNRRAFMLGQVDKYTWRDTGGSFGISDVLAAYLLAQLEQRALIQDRRRAVFERYEQLLAPHADELGYRLGGSREGCEQAYHMFYVLLPDRSSRDQVLAGMRECGVQPTFHYLPLHASEAGHAFAARETPCPTTLDISGRLLRLPFYNDLDPADVDRAADTFLDVVAGLGRNA